MRAGEAPPPAPSCNSASGPPGPPGAGRGEEGQAAVAWGLWASWAWPGAAGAGRGSGGESLGCGWGAAWIAGSEGDASGRALDPPFLSAGGVGGSVWSRDGGSMGGTGGAEVRTAEGHCRGARMTRRAHETEGGCRAGRGLGDRPAQGRAGQGWVEVGPTSPITNKVRTGTRSTGCRQADKLDPALCRDHSN